MIAAMSQDGPILVGGVPLYSLTQAAIRSARAAVTVPRATLPAMPAAATAAPEPTEALVALPCALRGFTLAELTVEADRVAAEAADNRDYIACVAFGRTFGDHTMKARILAEGPSSCLLRAHAEAATRADQAAATADFLRALVGREDLVELALTGDAGV